MAKLHSFPRFDTLYFSLWLWNVHPIIRLISSNGRRLCRSKMFGSCVWSFFCDSIELNGDIFLFRYAGYLCTWRIRTKLHNSCVVCVCVCDDNLFVFQVFGACGLWIYNLFDYGFCDYSHALTVTAIVCAQRSLPFYFLSVFWKNSLWITWLYFAFE